MSRARLFGVILGLVVAAATVTGVSGASASQPDNGTPGFTGPAQGQQLLDAVTSPLATKNYTSKNWAGYFTANTSDSNTTTFNSVHAQWKQQAITCTAPNAWALFWVGFDGWWNGSVEQGGSQAQCIGGVPRYSLWWEMYPHNQIQNGPAISAGDTIDGTVTYNTGSKQFSIQIKDLTNGATISQNVACFSDQNGCPRSSAEVISESTGGGGGVDNQYPLANYGTENYADIQVGNVTGHTGNLVDSAWNLGHVNSVSSQAVTKQTTSSTSGPSFGTTWNHA